MASLRRCLTLRMIMAVVAFLAVLMAMTIEAIPLLNPIPNWSRNRVFAAHHLRKAKAHLADAAVFDGFAKQPGMSSRAVKVYQEGARGARLQAADHLRLYRQFLHAWW